MHAVGWFCVRDNLVKVGDKLRAKDLLSLFGYDRLIRTEITTLIGLALKGPLDLSLPLPTTLQAYVSRTEELLREIHETMSAAWFAHFTPEKVAQGSNPFETGDALREPIFYGGESAYGFQYRDLSVRKYAADDAWLKAAKGFSIGDARQVAKAICDLQMEKVPRVHRALADLPPEEWTLLPGFEFSVAELVAHSAILESTVRAVVDAFAVPSGETNAGFASLGDFNVAAALPLIPIGSDSFLMLLQYGLLEALYDAPFYWMTADKGYWAKATEHRGRFTEEFARERLLGVFGPKHVFPNVDVFESKGQRLGEIDVLVVFGDRAIVLQAKSKKLTLEARKGNDLQIKEDFKKSVQDAYDQALVCAKALDDGACRFVPKSGAALEMPKFEEIYLFCVVSDHYPALTFQARQFLQVVTSDRIAPPYVMDVFTLDALTEMLSSPLRLLSYANRRTRYADRLMASHELTILSYHLKQNLWLQENCDMFMLGDDVAADLDVAMMVRRDGLQGEATPDGVLTRLTETSVGRLLSTIEHAPQPATIALGFMLLTISEETTRQISAGIDKIVEAARRDGQHHDITVAVGQGESGLTVHCNDYPTKVAASRLQSHCRRRKYKHRADSWFGICLSCEGVLRFGTSNREKWQHDAALEVSTRRMDTAPRRIAGLLDKPLPRRKLGRNDPCPCGSGRKYKKCCLGHLR
jgi:hypothetical protein